MSEHDYFTFRFALLGRRHLVCHYRGRVQILYPHIVGWRDGNGAAVCYRFEGESAGAVPPKGQWVSLLISNVSNVQSLRGDWRTGNPRTLPRDFVEEVDVQITVKSAWARLWTTLFRSPEDA